MRVLSILCHPDDMELTCAGTWIKCRKRGDDVFACHLANGNMGHEVIPPDELREIRTREAENAGKLVGFEVINGDIGDLTLNGSDFEQVKKELLRSLYNPRAAAGMKGKMYFMGNNGGKK